MRDDPKAWEAQDSPLHRQVGRRRVLQLMGYGAAGLAGAGVLAACGGTNPPPPSNALTPVGTVEGTPGAVRQIAPYFLGYNNVPIHSPSWDNADVTRAAVQMKPGTLRYPGGTVANYWDWRTGWFLPQAPGFFLNAPRSTYRLQELQIAVHATGAIPIYVLNMLTSDLNTQLEMLRTARSMGLPVQLIELGNEFYLSTPHDNVTAFPTGAEYGTVATTWIQAIRAEFPGVKIAAVGGVPASESPGSSRKASWTGDLLQTLHGADALTWHPYVSIPRGTVAPDASPGVGEQLLKMTSGRWQQFDNGAQTLPADMKLWITEYNFVDPSKEVFYRWVDGVFAAQMSLNFLAEARTELVCFYDMIGSSGYEAIFYDRQPQASPPLAPFALTAAGWAMRLLSETMHAMTSAQPLTFRSDALPAADPSSSPLQGWIFSDGKSRQAFLLNSGAESFVWKGAPALAPGAPFQQVAGDPFQIVTGPASLSEQSGALGRQLVLPAYSATRVIYA